MQDISARGEHTCFEIELDGKCMAVEITREAIEDCLGLAPDEFARMSEPKRIEFVRANMSIFAAAAYQKLDNFDSSANPIVLFAADI